MDYRSHYRRPQFPPKVDFGGPNNRLQAYVLLRLMLAGPAGLCWRLDRPGRTPSCCVAWQLQHWLSYLFYFVTLSFLTLAAPLGFSLKFIYFTSWYCYRPCWLLCGFFVLGSAAPPLGPFFFFFAPVCACCRCRAPVGPSFILELFCKLYFLRFYYWKTYLLGNWTVLY